MQFDITVTTKQVLVWMDTTYRNDQVVHMGHKNIVLLKTSTVQLLPSIWFILFFCNENIKFVQNYEHDCCNQNKIQYEFKDFI